VWLDDVLLLDWEGQSQDGVNQVAQTAKVSFNNKEIYLYILKNNKTSNSLDMQGSRCGKEMQGRNPQQLQGRLATIFGILFTNLNSIYAFLFFFSFFFSAVRLDIRSSLPQQPRQLRDMSFMSSIRTPTILQPQIPILMIVWYTSCT
jgi:hypothetical protein